WIARAAQPSATAAPTTPEPLAIAHALLWTALACVSVRFVPLWALIVVPLLADALARPAAALTPANATPDLGMLPASRTWVRRRLQPALGRLSDRLAATDAVVGKGLWSAVVGLVLLVVIIRGNGVPASTQRQPDAHFALRLFPVAAAAHLHA